MAHILSFDFVLSLLLVDPLFTQDLFVELLVLEYFLVVVKFLPVIVLILNETLDMVLAGRFFFQVRQPSLRNLGLDSPSSHLLVFRWGERNSRKILIISLVYILDLLIKKVSEAEFIGSLIFSQTLWSSSSKLKLLLQVMKKINTKLFFRILSIIW